jgi:hypothetical protein
MGVAQSTFAQFMASPAGRMFRVVVGLMLIGWGYAIRQQTTGTVLMVVGLLPLLAGALDVCVLSALLGGPLKGAEIRRSAGGDR